MTATKGSIRRLTVAEQRDGFGPMQCGLRSCGGAVGVYVGKLGMGEVVYCEAHGAAFARVNGLEMPKPDATREEHHNTDLLLPRVGDDVATSWHPEPAAW